MTPIEWLDHTADAAFRASGESVDDVFCEAAHALSALMFKLDSPGGQTDISRRIDAFAPSLPELLVEWLSELLAQRELLQAVFTRFEVAISGDHVSGFHLEGRAFGETLDCVRHHPGAEVKGITLLGLEVRQDAGAWIAQVVVDV
ncbi:MAG: archease [Candidatus Atribacteria bacterium]|jgi:SHS2 domain-containing protein|nr:MAG: archease [Candidatus Atribacteria bacterium]